MDKTTWYSMLDWFQAFGLFCDLGETEGEFMRQRDQEGRLWQRPLSYCVLHAFLIDDQVEKQHSYFMPL